MKEIDDILDEMRKHAGPKQLPHYRRLITGFVYRLEPLIRQLEADRDNWRRQALDEDARANAINSAANTNVDAKVYSKRDMTEAVVKAATQAVQLTNEKFAKRFSKTGNPAKMREALKEAKRTLCRWQADLPALAWVEVETVLCKIESSLSAPPRNCDVDGSKIKSESDFEKAFNLHKVSQCCSMCRYGDDEVGCTCTCSHPHRNDNGNYCDPDMPRIIISNTMQNYVCDLFEERTQ